MSVRISRSRGTWFSRRWLIADAAQKFVLSLVVFPLLLAFVALASLLGLH